MSRSEGNHGTDPSTVPSIEIGSFIAASPDNSEFIGSSSGVFFANTVFRAFAKSTPEANASRLDCSNVPDPGSILSCLGSSESSQEQVVAPIVLDPGVANGPNRESSTRSYGIIAPGLGIAPSPTLAKKLLMLYFQHWHPFFPILHGPTFFDEVNAFYRGDGSVESNPAAEESIKKRLCRAVTFQCVFNIVACTNSRHVLEPDNMIGSTSALMGLLGSISSSNDIPSIQALLVAELYLVVNMSLRKASTINGSVTRIIYHAGLHRCPFRYVALSHEMCDMRKRIFWSAYVLDKSISQLLGHPSTIQDSHVDVCIPGLIELHKPVQPRNRSNDSSASLEDQIRAHLPKNHPEQGQEGDIHTQVQSEVSLQSPIANAYDANDVSPGRNQRGSKHVAHEFVLSYLSTYSRLTGEVIDLFHQSIHSRSVTREKIHNLTCRIQSWWNGLPLSFQDISEHDPFAADPSYVAFFTILYKYLFILANRPFLSLPTRRPDFQSSLQTSISASCSIIQKLKYRTDDVFIMAWPGTLPAVWTSGLVIAFASLLRLYPLAKAKLELEHCLKILDIMGSRWPSARHCHRALKRLLDQLSNQVSEGLSGSSSGGPVMRPEDIIDPESQPGDLPRDPSTGQNQTRGTKRKLNDETGVRRGDQFQPMNANPQMSAGTLPFPVLEYNGPDFGFDATQLSGLGPSHNLVPEPNTEAGGFYDNVGWDAFIQGLGFDGRFNI